MKKYDSYKDSGIEWIGEIPSHWEELRMRYIGYLYGGLSGKSANDFNQENNPYNKYYIPFTNIYNNTEININDLQTVTINPNEKQNEVKKGDLFFLMSSENYDDVGKSSVLTEEIGETYLNSFCKGFRITNNQINPKFLNYYLLSKPLRHSLMIEANGFTRINLKIDKISDLRISFPPLKEQTAIATYLDRKTAEIDELIADKKRLLELYEEEKTVIINQAVTKGLNHDVKMKNSGIEWLGEIPEHWEVKKLKYFTKLQSGYAFKSELFSHEGTPIVRIGDISRNINYEECKKVKMNNIPSEYKINQFDTLIALSGATTGKTCFIEQIPPISYINQRVAKVKFKNKLLFYIINSSFFQKEISIAASGSAQENISNTQIENIILFVSPYENEQQSIVEYIETETARIDEKITKTEKLIELLTEYRTALISEVVTGKIKVTP